MHQRVGEVLIATVALVAALAAVGSPAWPNENVVSVAITVIVAATGYTAYSEYVNTSVRKSWAYTEWMPTLPWLGTGLAPLAQWLVVPVLALARGQPRFRIEQGHNLVPLNTKSCGLWLRATSCMFRACFRNVAAIG